MKVNKLAANFNYKDRMTFIKIPVSRIVKVIIKRLSPIKLLSVYLIQMMLLNTFMMNKNINLKIHKIKNHLNLLFKLNS